MEELLKQHKKLTIKPQNKMENKKVIVRGDRSGVFFGTLKARTGREVTLTDCRRLWYWNGADSISQIAEEGVTKPNDCKFTMTVSEIEILDAIEVIPCTKLAIDNINSVKVWKQ